MALSDPLLITIYFLGMSAKRAQPGLWHVDHQGPIQYGPYRGWLTHHMSGDGSHASYSVDRAWTYAFHDVTASSV